MNDFSMLHHLRVSGAATWLWFLAFTATGIEPTADSLRVGIYENRPKLFTTAEGRADGFFPMVLDAIAAAEGWQIQYVPGTWQEGLDRLERGEIDLMPDVAHSVERAELFAFNEETALISWGAIYTRTSVTVQAFEDLGGRPIAVLRGSIYLAGSEGLPALLDRFGLQARLVEVETQRGVFEALADGRADAGVVNNLFGAHLEREFAVRKSPLLFNPTQLRFAFPRSHPRTAERIARLDARLRELKEDPHSAYYRAIDQHLYGTPSSAAARARLTREEQRWIEQHPYIRLGIDPEFFPFVFRDEDGRFEGIGADYVRLLNERLGLNMQATPPLSWFDTMNAARTGAVDVLPMVGITGERKEYLLFTRSVVQYPRVILTRTDGPAVAALNDLATLRVAVQAETSHEGFLRDETSLRYMTFPTLQDTMLALSADRADAVVVNLASAAYWMRRLNIANVKVAAQVGEEPFALHFGVRKDWPELVSILDKALDLIDVEEEQAILNRWVPIESRRGLEPRVVWRIALRVAGVATLVFLIILTWTYRLKREVSRRRITEEQLHFRVSFERLVSEISARFVADGPEKVDQHIQLTLAEISAFTNATAGFLYSFDDTGRPVRTHAGGQVARLEAVDLHPPLDPRDAPWLARLMSNHALVAYAGTTAPDTSTPHVIAAPPWLRSGSLVEVPFGPESQVRGFLGLVDLDGQSPHWRAEDLSLLRLVSETISDALRRKASEEALQRQSEVLAHANRQLQELDRLKSLFIASVSHELRTPLNSIIGFTGVLIKGLSGDLNPKQRDQLNRVYHSAQHLLALITDVIDISKIEAGHIDIHIQDFALADVLTEAVESIRPMAQAKGLALEMEAPSGLRVRTDRKRVRQCVLNFLSNAVKYTERGHARIEARDCGDRFEIAVTDTGIGIRPADQERLFAPFVRLDSHLRIPAGGTGLGLYLTRKVAVELLQGAITVQSEPGKGSTFALQAPKDLSATAAKTAPET